MLGGNPWEPVMTSAPILIKRYARARLYDPAGRRYLTLEELRQWRRNGVAFVVIDVETGADVTRVLLA
jgi:polyhydroxyalkanoate synthesis regulator protein